MKNHLRILFFVVFLSHQQLGFGHADVVNERPPLSGAELEKHWRLNCKKTAEKLLKTYSEPGDNKNLIPPLSAHEITEIGYCAHIYNVPDSGRFQPCPNYRGAADLFAMPTNSATTTPKVVAKKLRQFFYKCTEDNHDN